MTEIDKRKQDIKRIAGKNIDLTVLDDLNGFKKKTSGICVADGAEVVKAFGT